MKHTDRNQSATGPRTQAETLAIEALAFLAGDAESLNRFLTLSGLAPQDVRAAAAQDGFLAGVLDYIAGEEDLLRAFAGQSGQTPQAFARRLQRARAVLGGWDRTD